MDPQGDSLVAEYRTCGQSEESASVDAIDGA